jgi:hypothetical protein
LLEVIVVVVMRNACEINKAKKGKIHSKQN